MKSALGENPKRVYGEQKKTPSTRLGTAAVIRQAFVEARNYLNAHEFAEPGKQPPARNLTSEALGLVLTGSIPWRQHCHRADDIATAVRIADEFGYRLVIDHGTEAHLIADLLVRKGIPVLIGPLFTSRSKVELRNRSLANPGCWPLPGWRSRSSPITRWCRSISWCIRPRSSVKEGLDRETALRAITINPARVLGLDSRLGSIAVGKDADLVLWSGDPLDVMQRALHVYIAGREVYAYDEAARAGQGDATMDGGATTSRPASAVRVGHGHRVAEVDRGTLRADLIRPEVLTEAATAQAAGSRPTRRAQSTSGICSGSRSHKSGPVPGWPGAGSQRHRHIGGEDGGE